MTVEAPPGPNETTTAAAPPTATPATTAPPPVEPAGAPAGVHPRFWERRLQVAQELGERRFRLFLYLIGAIVLAALAVAITRSPWLAVRTVTVSGTGQLDAGAVREATGIDTGDPMIAVNLGSVRSRLGAMAWVEKVSVKRSWPRTITIEITERKRAAAIADGDGTLWLVDRTGHVLEPARPETLAGVAAVKGPVQGTLVPAYALTGIPLEAVKVASSLPAAMRARLDHVGWDEDSGSLLIALAGDVVVRLGSTERLVDKYLAVLTVLSGPDAARLATIDVRSPTTPAVTVKGTGR